MKPPVMAAVALAIFAGCRPSRPAAPPGPVEASVFITAATLATLEPCGCAANMRGGVDRLATVLDRARGSGRQVVFLDVGSALFPAATVAQASAAQDELRARTLASAWRTMGLTAHLTGPFDDARGVPFREGLELPEVASGALRLVPVGGHTLGVVHGADLADADRLARTARDRGAVYVIAGVDGPLTPPPGPSPIDVVVSGQPSEHNRIRPGREPAEQVVEVQSRGRSAFRVDLTLRDRGPVATVQGDAARQAELDGLDQRVELLKAQVDEPGADPELTRLRQSKLMSLLERRADLAARPVERPATGNVATSGFEPVESTLPSAAALAGLLDGYNREVGRLNLAWATEHGEDCPPPSAEVPGFVGSLTCAGCHPAAMEVWRASRHPGAYRALVADGKQYHLDCIGCHVTGWQRPGGVCRVDRTAMHEEVGCEACHGPGSPHLASPVKATVARGDSATVCVQCHDAENSPHFDFAVYRERIRGPGHGLPLLDGGVASPPPAASR